MDKRYNNALATCKHLRLLAFVALSSSLVACGNPCRELSETICKCLTTYDARQRCNTRINTLASQFNNDKASPNYQTPERAAAGQQRCAALLETCTCQALQEGNLQACGLANEAGGL